MSEMSDDQLEAIKRVVKDNQTVDTWAGTIMNTVPLEVLLDGQGAAVPCLGIDFISLVAGRRCIVNRVGQDFVVIGTYGGPVLPTLTVTTSVSLPGPTTLISNTGSGSFTNTSGYAGLSTPASVVFVAPANGKAAIVLNGRLINTSGVATIMYLSTEVRTGGTVGAGGVVLGPSNGRAIGISAGASATVITGGRSDTLTGLTAGSTYNVQAMVICTSGSANDADAVTVEVRPVP